MAESKEVLDSLHPVMLRHPLTGKMVYVDLDVVVRVAEYYFGGGGEAFESIPRPWRKALLHYKDEILRLQERFPKKKVNRQDLDLCACLEQMSLSSCKDE